MQRHAELCRVAEVIQLKVCTLLLHQQRYTEALQQLKDHLATYAMPPGEAACCGSAGSGPATASLVAVLPVAQPLPHLCRPFDACCLLAPHKQGRLGAVCCCTS